MLSGQYHLCVVSQIIFIGQCLELCCGDAWTGGSVSGGLELGSFFCYKKNSVGATHGVTIVSTSVFVACHQCYCAGLSVTSGLEFSGFSMWHFLKLVARGFLRVLRFPSLLISEMLRPIK